MEFRIREAAPADSRAIARVHVDSWRSTYKGIISEEYLARLSYGDRETMWSRAIGTSGNIVLLAEDDHPTESGESIIGFISGGPNRSLTKDMDYAGELRAIYIIEQHRGKGIGKELVRVLVGKFLEHTIDSFLVWVLSKNPYRSFYEMLGGQFVRSQQISIGGTDYEEVAYGWKDANALLKMLGKSPF